MIQNDRQTEHNIWSIMGTDAYQLSMSTKKSADYLGL